MIWLSKPNPVHKGVLPGLQASVEVAEFKHHLNYRWCYVLVGDGVECLERQQAICSLLFGAGTQDVIVVDTRKAITTELVKQGLKPGCFVLPRQGSISAWSSKAKDILELCGFSGIRIERGRFYEIANTAPSTYKIPYHLLLDPMLESLVDKFVDKFVNEVEQIRDYLCKPPKKPSDDKTWSLLERSLEQWNAIEHLQLSSEHIQALQAYYAEQGHLSHTRYPQAAELMMYAQVNSEHCRHSIFKALWQFDGVDADSLFSWIQKTTHLSEEGVLSAYKDNGAVFCGSKIDVLSCDAGSGVYDFVSRFQDVVIKVETHNHPTAVSPYPGAATGVGGEIRDEVATGRGARSKGGMSGYMVSHLRIPGWIMPWEEVCEDFGYSDHIASSLDIMIHAPLGAARYGNEYGRAMLCGFFRTFEHLPAKDTTHDSKALKFKRGFHKPLMIAGGFGSIFRENVFKEKISVGDKIIVLGGPGMKIGLGGGSVSSYSGSESQGDLDFASVQRDNAEMQRRVFGVIEACFHAAENPIISIHDVGAGGLANAITEIVHEADLGAEVDMDAIPIADHTMTPKEIWCNESQERYVICLRKDDLKTFHSLCVKERAPYAVVGLTSAKQDIVLYSHKRRYVDMPLAVLFGQNSKRFVKSLSWDALTSTKTQPEAFCGFAALGIAEESCENMLKRLLKIPAVGDKSFLITIADRTVGGLTYLEPMVGPWQVPVADAGMTLSDFSSTCGEAIAVGERCALALLDPAASVRMAACEAIMNLVSAGVNRLEDICFSANWQLDFSCLEDQVGLYRAVHALSQWCTELGIAVPVGKDSMSMKMVWQNRYPSEKMSADETSKKAVTKQVSAPITCVITAFAHVDDVQQTLTPQWQAVPSALVWVRLASPQESFRLGGSSIAMAYGTLGKTPPDVNSGVLKRFFRMLRDWKHDDGLLAYHDISDGGLVCCVLEMAFASRSGVDISLDGTRGSPYAALFAEEAGCVVQVRSSYVHKLLKECKDADIFACKIADLESLSVTSKNLPNVQIRHAGKTLLHVPLMELFSYWSALSHKMQCIRDQRECALQERQTRLDMANTGLFSSFSEGMDRDAVKQLVQCESKPKVAILREQGVNGHREMAFAFLDSGFAVEDVTMEECLQNRKDIREYVGLVACGGFSYGDVLGAGRGWAEVIKGHNHLRDSFKAFFHTPKTFALGVCNGAQMLSHLKVLIPQASHFPRFQENRSKQFESRTVMVEILPCASIFWQHMRGFQLPVVVAHGEGRVVFEKPLAKYYKEPLAEYCNREPLAEDDQAPLSGMAVRYIDFAGRPTQTYPMNPSGSEAAIAGVCSLDGRVSILMPHPERGYLKATHSFKDPSWKGKYSPWREMFIRARQWVHSKERE